MIKSLRSYAPTRYFGHLFAGLFLVGMGLGTVSAQPTAVVNGTLPEDFYPGLKEILQTALKQSPQILSRNLDLVEAEAQRYVAESALWPNLGGNASYSSNTAASASAGFASSSTTS